MESVRGQSGGRRGERPPARGPAPTWGRTKGKKLPRRRCRGPRGGRWAPTWVSAASSGRPVCPGRPPLRWPDRRDAGWPMSHGGGGLPELLPWSGQGGGGGGRRARAASGGARARLGTEAQVVAQGGGGAAQSGHRGGVAAGGPASPLVETITPRRRGRAWKWT